MISYYVSYIYMMPHYRNASNFLFIQEMRKFLTFCIFMLHLHFISGTVNSYFTLNIPSHTFEILRKMATFLFF